MSGWIPVPKPTETSVTGMTGGTPIGLLLALTQTVQSTSIVSGWSDVSKPSSTSWVSIAKPTSSVWTLVAKPNS